MPETRVLDDTETEFIPFRYAITSYGADYPVDSLVQRLDRDVIFVPEFQRKYVWTLKQASRFIESLLLGLPVPGVFFAREADSGKLLIVDGQQRLRTLQYFYNGIFKGKEFCLTEVQPRYLGRTYKTLDKEDQIRLSDAVIHATIIRQDEPSEDQSSVYLIFERLNTGGTLLQPQEIRACIFHGVFAEFLEELNSEKDWRNIYGAPSKRRKDEELILRFLALLFAAEDYARPMNEFLNTFMGANRYFKKVDKSQIMAAFAPTSALIEKALGRKAFRPERALNAAVCDSVMVGLARRLKIREVKSLEQFVAAYDALLKDSTYLSVTKTSTADETNVRIRLEKATKAFAGLD